MSSTLFHSKAYDPQEPSLGSSAPRASNNILSPYSSRSSARSSSSGADVETGFLPDGGNKRQNTLKDYLPFRIFARSVSSSDTETSTNEKPGKILRRYRWLSIILLVALIGVTAALLTLEIPRRRVKPMNSERGLATWPIDSRDVTPIPCHSHNDYWRHVPLFDALAAGCTGVEADVWLEPEMKDDLYVGHTRKSLKPARTLSSLYVEPLLTILNDMNTPSNISLTPDNDTTKTISGVFDKSPNQSLTLLIDLKTSSESTFPIVLSALQPLIKQNYLTTWSKEKGLIPGPITVVGTGNTEFTSAILAPENSDPRFIFFDAPLATLASLHPKDKNDYNTNNSYYASVSYDAQIGKPFLGSMFPTQVRKVRRQIEAAKEKGLVSRYWDTPTWPKATKTGVWDVLVKEGVGVLSVDDLEGVKGFLGDGEGKEG
ncbi:MAG: hypothetical protein Q9209_003635 [Squamulea sp. 1 TL-2023]